MQQPYLSAVLVGRNDNYGGDFRTRLQRSVSNLAQQLERQAIRSEIIFVNYNPLPDGPPIETFIEWPRSTQTVGLRLITVSNAIHRELVADGQRKDVPVLEYMGKNAGIRRAKGEFILSMNPDIIVTEAMVKQFRHLKMGRYYRADRIDFEGDLVGSHTLTRVFLKGHDYPITALSELRDLRLRNWLLNKWKVFTPRISPLLNRFSKTVYYDNRECRYHCNVSGDIMLMHRNHWMDLHAHAEHPFIALHVDSLMVIQAAFFGLKEVVFKEPIFHQEHTRRYDASKQDPVIQNAWTYYRLEADAMESDIQAKIYNSPSWGLSKFDLPELKL